MSETSKKVLKKDLFFYSYKLKLWCKKKWFLFKKKFSRFNRPILIYLVFLVVSIFIISKLEINFNQDQLTDLGFVIAGIIGASIAIIFSFSTFILQSTAEFFSTRYLNKFIQEKNERYTYWFLVTLTLAACIVPSLLSIFVFEILISILFLAFVFIYLLYIKVRERINPETTLGNIKENAIHELNRTFKQIKNHSNYQNYFFEHNTVGVDLSFAPLYKASSGWNVLILENVKYLYEIGLRLLSKNEINSFNLTVKYIYEIHKRHLELRNGHIDRVLVNYLGVYSFEDEGFTSKILEYLGSIENRLIEDKRKENLYFLLHIYENMIFNSQNIKYAGEDLAISGENPILTLIVGYYILFIDKILATEENDWIWECVKSVSKTSNMLVDGEYNHFNYQQLVNVLNKISVSCISKKQEESFLKEIVQIYFNQIKIAWFKNKKNKIFWQDLFKELKKNTLLLSLTANRLSLSLSDLYIDFNTWQANTINFILSIPDKEEQNKLIEAYTDLLEEWSDFLLDLSRELGLENQKIGRTIIQSVQNNTRVIYVIKHNFEIDVVSIYKTQLNIISWYFKNTENVDSSHLFNLEEVQFFLLREISGNLEDKVFDVDQAVDLYISLVVKHFEKVTPGSGYNHPRIIEKLIYLGLILTARKIETARILKLIDDLNQKYLSLNVGDDEYRLCYEIHDLKEKIFTRYNGVGMDSVAILKEEINIEIWEQFVSQIKYCEGIEYTTVNPYGF